MADHLWFIPAVGAGTGGGLVQELPNQNSLNLNYGSFSYPSTDAASLGITIIHSLSVGGGGNAAAQLGVAYPSFSWRNSGNSSCNGIAASLKLLVGTVFAAELDATPTSWAEIDIWAKFIVSDVNKLSGIYLSINDLGGAIISSSTLLPAVTNNTWLVGKLLAVAAEEFEDLSNLRAVLTFVGVSAFAANALGEVSVGVEWMAIRLRDQA